METIIEASKRLFTAKNNMKVNSRYEEQDGSEISKSPLQIKSPKY
jgi:hypothetical protein